MVFSAALTGISAASSELSVIGNNIANASTAGFKSSRIDFSDIYTSTSGANAIGAGVVVSDVKQQFTQGNINFTSNSLDLAISGDGFFRVSDGGSTVYTRAGSFSLDREGYIVNGANQRLQGLNADSSGTLGALTSDIQLDTSNASPNATTAASVGVNLNALADPPEAAADVFVGGTTVAADTFTNLSSTTVYDSLGNPHVLTTYYIKANTASGADSEVAGSTGEWYLGFKVDDNDLYTISSVGGGATDNSERLPTISFDSDGDFSSVTAPAAIAVGSVTPSTNGISASSNLLTLTYAPGGGADTMAFTVDFNSSQSPSTQFVSDFSLEVNVQDGFGAGRLEDLEINSTGLVFGRFSNGQSRNLGQVQLANFANKESLRPAGETGWFETFASGQPTLGIPQSGSLGSISSGALEESNVDLTSELVKMITAQRNFQANAQTIRTGDAITQTIINLR